MALNRKSSCKHKRSVSHTGSFFSNLLSSQSHPKVCIDSDIKERQEKEKTEKAGITVGIATTSSTSTKTSHPKLAITSSLQVPIRSVAQKIYHVHQRSTPQSAVAKIDTMCEPQPIFQKPNIVTPLVTTVSMNTVEGWYESVFT